ncbi:MAG: hypothetical protein GXO76_08335 [Calditrichaeota bacterium]|nr:hypothetical protein [Calditrichota bacterium]
MDYKEFIHKIIVPKYGPQPARFKDWDKGALREFYISFLRSRVDEDTSSRQLEEIIRLIEEQISC